VIDPARMGIRQVTREIRATALRANVAESGRTVTRYTQRYPERFQRLTEGGHFSVTI